MLTRLSALLLFAGLVLGTACAGGAEGGQGCGAPQEDQFGKDCAGGTKPVASTGHEKPYDCK